jgi:Na+-transporting NADH:ubiquinone oxidoreductase subunit A
MIFQIKRGLNIPIAGAPVQKIEAGPTCTTVALLGADYLGLRPTMMVKPGERVQLGQPLLEDKKNPGVMYASPASGTVVDVNRGEKRVFQSVVVAVGDGGDGDAVRFDVAGRVGDMSREEIRSALLQSGMWPALRSRPFSRVPSPESSPHSIFVTAMDTQPLAAEPELIIDRNRELFVTGLHALKSLTDGPVYVCTRTDSRVPGQGIAGVQMSQFAGPHPAGLVGTHIHFLDPAGSKRTVWHINYQDVIAVGHLFTRGTWMAERVVSLAGPSVLKPRLLTTRVGANLDELIAGELAVGEVRVVSGSVISGRTAVAPNQYLGRYHLQVSALPEGRQREFLGWQRPGPDKFSITKIYVGSWLKHKLFRMTTNLNGGRRAMVPVGTYERVMPLDILATPLLRSLIVGDTDSAQALGALELDEEDLALCTFVCPGKYEYGKILRENLDRIEKEG